jgi:hypothetical protein
MPEVHGVPQLLRIERPPLRAVNNASVRQSRHTVCSIPDQPNVVTGQTDASLCCKNLKRNALIKVQMDQAFPTDRR